MNNIEFSYDKKIINIEGIEITMPYEIADVLEVGSLIIVRVEPVFGEILNDNIYAFSKGGELIWKIEKTPHGTEQDQPYTSLSLSEDNRVIVGNWNGVDYKVNTQNGSITPISFNK